MRIATWNIGEDETNKDGKLDYSSYEYILKRIKEEDIDILCLQEAIIKSDYLPPIAEYIKQNSELKYNIQYELSDSHINIGCRMGVVICSKYEIKNSELFMLDNPNLVYSVDNNITYYSHDKGFIIATIKNYKIITGHCLPFHVFKKNPLILHVNDRLNNQYDYKKVLAIYNIFKSLCTKYNQEINQNRFLYFSGIDKQSLYNWDNNGKAKPYGFDLLAIIRNDTEQSMSEMLGDKGVNALGTIAKLNHYFGWREDGNRTQNINISVSESPKAIADRYKAALTDSQLSDNSGQNEG